tara:strand:- start:5474 stop:5647 length:174 start_codon:yes stop_codon:yes gene_type:complete
MQRKKNNKIVIRIEEVEDKVNDKKFYRVIINAGERLVNILESKKKPEILRYKSIVES